MFSRKIAPVREWVWILQTLVYIGVIVTYFMCDGKEKVFELWIPLDICIAVVMAAYYFWHVHEQRKKEEVKNVSLMERISSGIRS